MRNYLAVRRSNVLIIALLLPLYCYSQSDPDSLKKIWNNPAIQDSIRFEAYHDLIYGSYLYTKPDSGYILMVDLLNQSRKNRMPRMEIKAILLMSYYYHFKSNHTAALSNAYKALRLANSIPYIPGQVLSHIILGNAYWDLGKPMTSFEHYNIALEISQQTNFQDGEALSLNNIGNIYLELGEENKALEYFLRCINLMEESGVRDAMDVALSNMGEIYLGKKEYSTALEFLEDANAHYRLYNEGRNESGTLIIMGMVYAAMKEYELARSKYEEGILLATQLNTKKQIARGNTGLGNLYLTRNISDSAIGYCKTGLEVAEEIKIIGLQIDACECLFKAYEKQGARDKAMMYQLRFFTLKDSLKVRQTDREILKKEFANQLFVDSMARVEMDLEREINHQAEIARKDQATYISYAVVLLIFLVAGGLWSRVRWIRKANSKLRKLKERAERSEHFEKRFLANMSHEIRTPMNAVLGMTNLTLDTQLDEKQENYLNAIKNSSESLLVIINDILDLSKIEAGKMEVERIPYSVKDLVEQAYNTLRFKAEEKGLVLESNISSDVPEYLVGDPSRLNQVLINLCGNAIKFTEKGKVEIKVRRQNKTAICFEINDTGIGIPEEKLGQLFTSFKQMDASTSRKYGGTGLGLSISKNLIQLQGGKIWAESEIGKGSSFKCLVPLLRASSSQEEAMKKGNELDYQLLSGARILIAEDNEYNRIVVHDTLENLVNDIVIESAYNGKEALDKLKSNDFDMILMDANMPEMDGLEATRKIRTEFMSPKKDIPIIALTASVLLADINECYKAGMNAYVPKPFKREELVQAMIRFYKSKNPKRKIPISKNQKVEEKLSPTNNENETLTNLHFLKEFCSGDEARMKKYVDMYLDSTPENIKKIEFGTKTGDFESVKTVVHTMKPHLNFMGMKASRGIADKIEEMILEGNTNSDLKKSIEILIQDCRKSLKELS